jgi:predicted tellurium resistance membrane protein TerC
MAEFLAFDWVTNPQIWLSLVTLTALEIVLGVDNLVFLAILTNRLPEAQRPLGRKVGLSLALGTRLLLLATLAWIVTLTQPVFAMFRQSFSWRDLILIGGGLFLLVKATHEIHNTMEGEDDLPGGHARGASRHPAFGSVVIQIAIIDIIFSLDSVITAVGMTSEIGVMVAAVVIAVIVMMVFAKSLSEFVERHPTVKMLALSFLLLIGVALIADGMQFHIPRGYIYFAMGFSVMVEMLNLRIRGRRAAPPVQLRAPVVKR